MPPDSAATLRDGSLPVRHTHRRFSQFCTLPQKLKNTRTTNTLTSLASPGNQRTRPQAATHPKSSGWRSKKRRARYRPWSSNLTRRLCQWLSRLPSSRLPLSEYTRYRRCSCCQCIGLERCRAYRCDGGRCKDGLPLGKGQRRQTCRWGGGGGGGGGGVGGGGGGGGGGEREAYVTTLLHCIALHRIALHHITSHHITCLRHQRQCCPLVMGVTGGLQLHYITLHYTRLHILTVYLLTHSIPEA